MTGTIRMATGRRLENAHFDVGDDHNSSRMQAWAQHALIILPDIIRQKYQILSNLYDRFFILDDRLVYIIGKP
jgi:hypothetical protein